MVAMSRRVELNLNRGPAPSAALWESVKDGLRQVMLQHGIIFKNQVRELHRLYWTQKNLMSEMRWKQSVSVSAAKSRCGSAEANEVGGILMVSGSPSVRERHKGFVLEVPAMDFHGEPAREVTDELFVVKGPGSDRSDAAGRGCGGGNCNDGDPNRGFSRGNGRFVIDLETPAKMYPVEDADAICSSGLKSLQDGDANVNDSQVNAFSGFILATGLQRDSICQLSEEKYSVDHQRENWLKESFVHTDSDVCPEPLQKFPSPSASSSFALHGDQWRKSNWKYPSNAESNSKYQTQPNSVLPNLELSYYEKWMYSGLKDGHNLIRQSSELSSTVEETAWHYEKSALDTEVDRSGTGSPVEFCRNSMEGIPSKSNGGTQNSTNGSAISFIELHKHTDEKVVPLLVQKHVNMHNVSRSETSNITSGNEIEDNCLHPSTEIAYLIPSTDGAPGRKQISNDKNEEDRVSSRAIFCEQLGVRNEKSSDCKRLCSNNGALVPETSGVCLDDRSFDTCVSNPEEADQQQTPIRELELMIFNAADTLISFSLENPASPFNFNCAGQMVFENDESKNQPQYSLDSFEEMTLRLEETKDDGSSVTSKRVEKESCGIKLRRGRGLRDFQKDILPGLVSLSRHEICEDMHTIEHELRKIRSHKTGQESFLMPVRTRRSRIYNACRRT